MASRPPVSLRKTKSPTRSRTAQNGQSASSASRTVPSSARGAGPIDRSPPQRQRGKQTINQRSTSCKRSAPQAKYSSVRASCSVQSCVSKLAETLVQRLEEHVQKESSDSAIPGISRERQDSTSVDQAHTTSSHETPMTASRDSIKESAKSWETSARAGSNFKDATIHVRCREKTFTKFTKPNAYPSNGRREQTKNFFRDISSAYHKLYERHSAAVLAEDDVRDSASELPKNLRTGNTPALGVRELKRRSYVRSRIAATSRDSERSGQAPGGSKTTTIKVIDPEQEDLEFRGCVVETLKTWFQGQGNVDHSQLSCELTPNPLVNTACTPDSSCCVNMKSEDAEASGSVAITSPRPLVNKRWTCSVNGDASFRLDEDTSPPKSPVRERTPVWERSVTPTSADPAPMERMSPERPPSPAAATEQISAEVTSPSTCSKGVQVCLVSWPRPSRRSRFGSHSPFDRRGGKVRSDSPSSIRSAPVSQARNKPDPKSPRIPRSPKLARDKAQSPLGNRDKAQSPQGNRGKAQSPQGNRGKAQSPQSNRGKAQSPQGNRGKGLSPQGNRSKTQSPQRSMAKPQGQHPPGDKAQTPQCSTGRSHTSTHSQDKSPSPQRSRNKSQSPQRPRDKTSLPQPPHVRLRGEGSAENQTAQDSKRHKLLDVARQRTESMRTSTSPERKTRDTNEFRLPPCTTTDLVHFIEQISKDKKAVKIINCMALLAKKLQQ